MDAPAAIENNYAAYSCSASGGVPQAESFMWFIGDEPVFRCENISVSHECEIVIKRAYHNQNLKCQEFQRDYLAGARASTPLDVLCA